jgi:hypothetical protein
MCVDSFPAIDAILVQIDGGKLRVRLFQVSVSAFTAHLPPAPLFRDRAGKSVGSSSRTRASAAANRSLALQIVQTAIERHSERLRPDAKEVATERTPHGLPAAAEFYYISVATDAGDPRKHLWVRMVDVARSFGSNVECVRHSHDAAVQAREREQAGALMDADEG